MTRIVRDMKRKLTIALLLLLLTPGCLSVTPRRFEKPITNDTAILKTTLSCLNLESPQKDVDRNINNGDLRFICVCGFACYTPGVQKDDLLLTKKYGVRCLDGTSDAIEGEEHGKLIEMARQYAEQYNMVLLKKLKFRDSP